MGIFLEHWANFGGCQKAGSIWPTPTPTISGFAGPLSQADRKLFLAAAAKLGGDGFDAALRRVRDAQYLALLGPAWGQISQAGDADILRQPFGNQSLYDVERPGKGIF